MDIDRLISYNLLKISARYFLLLLLRLKLMRSFFCLQDLSSFNHHRCILFIFIYLFLPITLCATDGMFPLFMGVPAAGRAGVDIGIASDPTCINTNPGGLGFLHGKMIEFSAGAFYPDISFSNSVNDSSSLFELIPFGSFAAAWDSPGQTGQVFTDPWTYTFGGTPQPSEYLFISGNQAMAGIGDGNEDNGVFHLTMPSENVPLRLVAQGQGAQILHLQMIVGQNLNIANNGSQPNMAMPRDSISPKEIVSHNSIINPHNSLATFFVGYQLPRLPLQAKVVVVSVHFTWQATSSDASIQLHADEISASLPKSSVVAGQKGYLAVAWTKASPPTLIKVLGNPQTNITVEQVLIGYRLEAKTYWESVSADEEWQKEAYAISHNITPTPDYANDATKRDEKSNFSTSQAPISYTIFADPQIIPEGQVWTLELKDWVDGIKPGSNIQFVYRYRLDHKNPSRHLKIALQNSTQILSENYHGKVAREAAKPIPVCRRSADHEEPHLGRTSGWKFGFGIFPQAGARYSIKVKSNDFFMDGVENRTDLMFVSVAPTIAYRFNDSLSIGISLNLNAENLELDGLVMQPSLILRGKPIQGTNTTFGEYLIAVRNIYNIKGELDCDYLTGFGIGGRIGLLWKVNDRLQLGLMYSPKTVMMEASGNVTLDFNRHFKQIDVANIVSIILPNKGQYGFSGDYLMKLEFDLPQQAGIGVSYLLTNNLLLAADFRWINYSDTQFELKAKVKNGTNADLNALIGGTGTTVKLPVGWKDQYVASFGLVWQSSPQWIWRLGYNYCNNPVAEEYLNPQLAAISEHHVSMGASYVLDRNLTIHTALEYALPSTLESGDMNLVHEKYANSKLDTFSIGFVMGMTWRF